MNLNTLDADAWKGRRPGLPTHAPLPAGSCWLALRCTSCAPRSQHVRLKFTCPLLNATVYATALRHRASDRRANVHSTRLTPQSTKSRGPASPAKRWQGILRKNTSLDPREFYCTRVAGRAGSTHSSAWGCAGLRPPRNLHAPAEVCAGGNFQGPLRSCGAQTAQLRRGPELTAS